MSNESPRLTLLGKPITWVDHLPGELVEIGLKSLSEPITITLVAEGSAVSIGGRVIVAAGELSRLQGTIVEINGNECVIMPDDRPIEEERA